MDVVAAWDELGGAWRRTFELAWEAHGRGTIPVGAVIAAPDGEIVAEGRNRIFEGRAPAGELAGTRLAHAEVNALAHLDLSRRWEDHTLYTSLEPCVRRTRRRRRSLMSSRLLSVVVVAMMALSVVALAGGAPVMRKSVAARSQKEQNDLLTQILRGFVNSQIVEAKLSPPPPPYDESDDIEGIPSATWVSYKIEAKDMFAYKRGKWQALVASGLLRDMSTVRSLPPIVGHSFTMVSATGSERYDASATITGGGPSPAAGVPTAQLKELVKQAAPQVKAALADFRMNKPLGLWAPEVVLQTSDPQVFMGNLYNNIWDVVGSLNGESGTPLTEGAYVEVRDSSGKLLAVSAFAARTREGTGYVDPSFISGSQNIGGVGGLTHTKR